MRVDTQIPDFSASPALGVGDDGDEPPGPKSGVRESRLLL
jgi:hypothetical protein